MAPRNEPPRSGPPGGRNNRTMTWGLVVAAVVLVLVFLMWPRGTTEDATMTGQIPETAPTVDPQPPGEVPMDAEGDPTPPPEAPAPQ